MANKVSSRLPKPIVSLRLECAELDVNFAMFLPLNNADRVPYQRILQALASVGLFGSGYDLGKAEELQKFEANLQHQDNVRKERHQFYKEVEKNSEHTAKTMQTMKRDYYREIDNLREQLNRKARNPNFEPDNVFFFDMGAYKLPSWETVADKLDDMRMQRELILKELGGSEKIMNVPMHMLCADCRNRFKGLDEQGSGWCCDRAVQTDASDLTCDAIVQTDEKSFRVLRKGAPSDCIESCAGSTRFEGSGAEQMTLGDGELSDEALDRWNALMDDDEFASQTWQGREDGNFGLNFRSNLCVESSEVGDNHDSTSSHQLGGGGSSEFRGDTFRNASSSRDRQGVAGEASDGDRLNSYVAEENDEERKPHIDRLVARDGDTNDACSQIDTLRVGENSTALRGRILSAEEKAERLQAVLVKTFANQALDQKRHGFRKLKDNWSARQMESIRKHVARQGRNPELEKEPKPNNNSLGSLKKPRNDFCLDSLPMLDGSHSESVERLDMELAGDTTDERTRRPASSGGERSTRNSPLGDEEQELDVEKRHLSLFGAGGRVVKLEIGLPSPSANKRNRLGNSFGNSFGKRVSPTEGLSSNARASSASRGSEILAGDRGLVSRQGVGLSASAGSLTLPSIDVRLKSHNSSSTSLSRKDFTSPEPYNSSFRSRRDVPTFSAPRQSPCSLGLNSVDGKRII